MKRLLLTVAALPICATPVLADAFQATNWMAPAHILNEFPYQEFARDVAELSGGEINFEVYSSGALVPAPTTMQAISDEAHREPETVTNAPHLTRLRRLDETRAARSPVLRYTRPAAS